MTLFSNDAIDHFDGENVFLSNFYFSPIRINHPWLYNDPDEKWRLVKTVEHAYQAAKTNSIVEAHKVFEASTPGKAKKLGQKVTKRKDWDEIKIEVMERYVLTKFESHKDLGEKLLATGDRELIEGNTWKDRYWGVYQGEGENHLGRVLMRVRENLRGNTPFDWQVEE